MLDADFGEDDNGPYVTVRAGTSVWTWWSANPDNATELATQLQEQWVIEEVGRAWPRCLKHGRHPMIASDQSWCCSLDREPLAAIGTLTQEGPEPDVPDGVVRWYLGDYGFGAIAHHEGDLWFHFSAIEMEGFKALDEDTVVDFDVDPGRQGAYRRASRVRPVREGS